MNALAQLHRHQFSLAILFEYTTACALLAASKPIVGIFGAGPLMLIPIALAIGNGLLTLVLFLLAAIGASLETKPNDTGGLLRQGAVFILTLLLCAWVQSRCRRRAFQTRARVFPIATADFTFARSSGTGLRKNETIRMNRRSTHLVFDRVSLFFLCAVFCTRGSV